MKKIALILSLALITCTLSACGSSSSEEMQDVLVLDKNDPYSFLNGMEDGVLYVLHPDNTYEETVFNEATFRYGDVADGTSLKRIIWFKEDFDDIPTFHEDQDKLVMYTKAPVTETITLERFKDLGISVGLCQLKPLESGKYSISTDPENYNTYPESDADAILEFHNPTVIIDKVQKLNLRTDESLKLNEEKNIDYETTKEVSEYGTLTNLYPNNYYDIDIYDGTEKTTLKLYADTHIMGSCKVMKKLNYHFTDNYLQEFELPPDLYTGYYTINSLGMFRFISKNDVYSMNTNYNVGIEEENEEKEEEKDEKKETTYVEPEQSRTIYGSSKKDEIIDEANANIPEALETEEDTVVQSYEVEAENAYIRFAILLDTDPENTMNASATVTTPNGVAVDMTRIDSSGNFYADVFAEMGGNFKVTMHNMSAFLPTVQASEIEAPEGVLQETEGE